MDSKENTLLRRYSVTYVNHPAVRGQVTRNNYYQHVRALISFPRLPETGAAAHRGKNARPQTHHTLRYTIAHLFRARPCNRSYVTEEAVRLPQAELRAIRANVTRGLHHSVVLCEMLSFREGIRFFHFLETSYVSVSRRKFNFRRYCPHLTTMTKSSSSVNPWLDCIVPFQRDIKGGENGNALASGAWFLSKPVINSNRCVRNSNT